MDFHEKISNAFNRAQNNDLNNFDMLSFIDKSPTTMSKYQLNAVILREKRHPLIKDYFHH
jgi:hypothetical protein